MNKNLALLSVLFLSISYSHAATLCGESGCNATITFAEGGSIKSGADFTINLGSLGKITGSDPAIEITTENTASTNQLVFPQGGEIVLNAGNISYRDDSKLEFDGVVTFRIDQAGAVAIENIRTAGTVAVNAQSINVNAASDATKGVHIISTAVEGAIEIQSVGQVDIANIESAAIITLNAVRLNICDSGLVGATVSCPDATIDWSSGQDVKAIWLGQYIDVGFDGGGVPAHSTFGYLSYQTNSTGTTSSTSQPWDSSAFCSGYACSGATNNASGFVQYQVSAPVLTSDIISTVSDPGTTTGVIYSDASIVNMDFPYEQPSSSLLDAAMSDVTAEKSPTLTSASDDSVVSNDQNSVPANTDPTQTDASTNVVTETKEENKTSLDPAVDSKSISPFGGALHPSVLLLLLILRFKLRKYFPV